MLDDMVRVDLLNGIVCGVNERVAVLERSLEHKRGRVTIPCRRAMVRAGVSTLALDVGNVGVLADVSHR